MKILASLALCVSLASAQNADDGTARGSGGPALAGQFFVYGNGCPGSGAGLTTSIGLNANATATQAGGNNNQFALKALNNTAAPIVVSGFELFTVTVAADPVTLTTELYDETSVGGPPNLSPIRTGSMVVGTKVAFYRTTFATHLLMPGASVFLSFLGTAAIVHPRSVPSGTLGVHYYHLPAQTAWMGPYTSAPWAWRVLSPASTGARPLISSTSVPTIGQLLFVGLSEANPSSPAVLLLGASSSVWGSLTLPFDLGILNAPGCFVRASGEITLSATTSSSGAASMPIVIPNDPGLLGVRFVDQWLVVDPLANGLMVVMSDAAEGRIG